MYREAGKKNLYVRKNSDLQTEPRTDHAILYLESVCIIAFSPDGFCLFLLPHEAQMTIGSAYKFVLQHYSIQFLISRPENSYL